MLTSGNLIKSTLAVLFISIASSTIAQVPPTRSRQRSDAQVYFDKADSLGQEGQYKEAIEAYKKGLSLNPNSAYYYNQLSAAHSKLNQDIEAVEAAKKALEIEPNDAYSYARLGFHYHRLQKYDEAIKAYNQATVLSPRDAISYASLGRVYTRLKQYDGAIKVLQKSLEIEPQNAETHLALSSAYLEAGNNEETIKASKQAILYRSKDTAIAYNNIGYAYQRLGQYGESASALKQAIELNPRFMTAYNNLGKTLFLLGRHQEAAEVLQQAISMDPREFWPHMNLGGVYFALQRYKQAAEELKQATQIDPKSDNAFIGLALAYNLSAQYEEAIEAFTQVVNLKPQEANAFHSRSYSNLYLGRGEAAAGDAQKYLEFSGGRNSRDQYMYLVAYFGYRQADRDADANKVLEDAIAKIGSKSWPYPVFLYLHRESNANELLALATDGNKKTEANAYIGTDLLLSDHPEEARPYLQWVRDNGNKNFVEYSLAVAQLNRLEKQPEH